MTDYDLIIIGAGPAGYEGAIKASQLGLKTLLIEKENLGGTCLNKGCIPTKTLLHSSELFSKFKSSDEFGINFSDLSFDYDKIFHRKNSVVETLRNGIDSLIKANKIDLVYGSAKIIAKGKISVNGETYLADKILIATGSKPSIPPISGIENEGVITSDSLLTENKFYNSMVIIGGGVIGVEFASIFSSFGVDCTIIEFENRILPTLDKDISQNMSMILKKRGVKIFTNSLVKNIEKNGLLKCNFENKDELNFVTSEGVLISTGRTPNIENLFDENLEIKTDRNFIVTDENFETSIDGIFAVGDVAKNSIQLAHFASAQAINAVLKIANKKIQFDLSLVPSCIYTEPEIASVGITEAIAKENNIKFKVGKYIMNSNGKTLITSSDRGFIKVIFDEETRIILGAQLMCERATDFISEFTLAIENKLTEEDLLKIVRPHPTFAEATTEAIENAFGISIHSMLSKLRK